MGDAQDQISRMADHAASEFLTFFGNPENAGLTSEVAFEIPNPTRLRDLYRVDGAQATLSGTEVVEISHTVPEGLEVLDFSYGSVSIKLYPASWCDLEISSSKKISEASILPWFDDWFGLESGREGHVPSGQPGGMIHVGQLSDGTLNLDLGTAPPGALFHLIECLAGDGHQSLVMGRVGD